MIGRDCELTGANVALDEAASGMVAIVVEGEAGIGKTTVWQEASKLKLTVVMKGRLDVTGSATKLVVNGTDSWAGKVSRRSASNPGTHSAPNAASRVPQTSSAKHSPTRGGLVARHTTVQDDGDDHEERPQGHVHRRHVRGTHGQGHMDVLTPPRDRLRGQGSVDTLAAGSGAGNRSSDLCQTGRRGL